MPVEAISPIASLMVSGAEVSTPVSVPFWLELIAIMAASVSGALVARELKLDLVGAVCLSVVCSLGGGLLRDMILQIGDVYILTQPAALPAAILTAIVVFCIPSFVQKQDRLIALLDIFAVGLYAATGADKALVNGFNPLICITMGFITAVGGGMLRDICLGQVPRIFQRSTFYALAALGGTTVYTLLADIGITHVAAVVACVVITMALRFISLRYNIMSPTELEIPKVSPKAMQLTAARAVKRTLRSQKPGRSFKGSGGHPTDTTRPARATDRKNGPEK